MLNGLFRRPIAAFQPESDEEVQSDQAIELAPLVEPMKLPFDDAMIERAEGFARTTIVNAGAIKLGDISGVGCSRTSRGIRLLALFVSYSRTGHRSAHHECDERCLATSSTPRTIPTRSVSTRTSPGKVCIPPTNSRRSRSWRRIVDSARRKSPSGSASRRMWCGNACAWAQSHPSC